MITQGDLLGITQVTMHVHLLETILVIMLEGLRGTIQVITQGGLLENIQETLLETILETLLETTQETINEHL